MYNAIMSEDKACVGRYTRWYWSWGWKSATGCKHNRHCGNSATNIYNKAKKCVRDISMVGLVRKTNYWNGWAADAGLGLVTKGDWGTSWSKNHMRVIKTADEWNNTGSRRKEDYYAWVFAWY